MGHLRPNRQEERRQEVVPAFVVVRGDVASTVHGLDEVPCDHTARDDAGPLVHCLIIDQILAAPYPLTVSMGHYDPRNARVIARLHFDGTNARVTKVSDVVETDLLDRATGGRLDTSRRR